MTKQQIQIVTNGNEAAGQFLAAFVSHCHMLDDVIDRDQVVTDEALIKCEIDWLTALCGNPWFQQHKLFLLPLIVQGYNAWLDSNIWQRDKDSRKRIGADVLKGWYHEVVWHTAFLCGGWEHLRVMTKTYREYDFEPQEMGTIVPTKAADKVSDKVGGGQ